MRGLKARLAAPDFPWWLVALGTAALVVAGMIAADEGLLATFRLLLRGLGTTLLVTISASVGALLLGLVVALAGRSSSRLVRNAARFYVELVRGVPVLVLLFWIAFAGVPGLVALWNAATAPLQAAGLLPELLVRDVSLLARGAIALVVAYAAFVAEILRAGIEAVPRGQVEAAQALGLPRGRVTRLVILPQAARTVLPPLANELVSMVKDSSLVSVLGVADITQMGKVSASGSFRFFETYSLVAYLYLLLTVTLSLAARRLERRFGRGARI